MKTILVVDANFKDLLRLKEILHKVVNEIGIQAEILAANSGAEALGLIETEGIDMLITEFSMPDVGGLDLIRALPDRFEIVKILVASNRIEIEARVMIAEEGIQAVLKKPIDENELRSILQRFL